MKIKTTHLKQWKERLDDTYATIGSDIKVDEAGLEHLTVIRNLAMDASKEIRELEDPDKRDNWFDDLSNKEEVLQKYRNEMDKFMRKFGTGRLQLVGELVKHGLLNEDLTFNERLLDKDQRGENIDLLKGVLEDRLRTNRASLKGTGEHAEDFREQRKAEQQFKKDLEQQNKNLGSTLQTQEVIAGLQLETIREAAELEQGSNLFGNFGGNKGNFGEGSNIISDNSAPTIVTNTNNSSNQNFLTQFWHTDSDNMNNHVLSFHLS